MSRRSNICQNGLKTARVSQWAIVILLDFGQLTPQRGARTDAAMVVSKAEFLVRAVRIVVVPPPAQKEHVPGQLTREMHHDRNRAALANIDGLRAESDFNSAGRCMNIRAGERHGEARG